MKFLNKIGLIGLLFTIGLFTLGNTSIGPDWSKMFQNLRSSLIPYTNNAYDLGSLSKMIRSAYIYSSLYMTSSAYRQYISAYGFTFTNHGLFEGNLIVEGTITAHEGYVQTKYLKFTIPTPAILYGFDTQVCLIPNVPNAMTITKLEVTCDANPTTELTGDIKYADTFIGLANPVVINDFDTADGVRVDTSITTGAVPAGKCVYLQWDTDPDAAMTQMSVIITYTVTE